MTDDKKQELLKEIEEYEKRVDGQGWEIDYRHEAMENIYELVRKQERQRVIEMIDEMKHPENTMEQRRKGCGNHNAGYECCRNEALTDLKEKLQGNDE